MIQARANLHAVSGYLIASFILLSSCGTEDFYEAKGKRQEASHTANGDLLAATPEFEIFTDSDFIHSIDQTLNRDKVTVSEEELIWSLSKSKLLPRQKIILLKSWGKDHGALTQVFAPTIRAEIRKNRTLRLIADAGAIIQSLIEFFVRDETIAEAIRESIVGVINKALGISTQLKNLISGFRFDLFVASAKPSSLDLSFTPSDQLTRWDLAFSMNQVWETQLPIEGVDHGVQLFEVLRCLSEFQYILGLDKTPGGEVVGGLTYSLDQSAQGGLKEFDLRTNPSGKRFIAGTYSVTYPDFSGISDLLELVNRVPEIWKGNLREITLKEQARLLDISAKMLERLRPANRGKTAQVFDYNKGAIPSDAYGIPITLLIGIGDLLSEKFIDEDARTIKKFVSVDTDIKGHSEKLADLDDLISLGEAAQKWVEQLSTVDDLYLIPKIQRVSLSEGRAKMLKLLRFIAQIQTQKLDSSNKKGSHLTENEALLSSLRLLNFWTELSTKSLNSPYLQDKTVELAKEIAQSIRLKTLKEGQILNLADVIELSRFAKNAEESGIESLVDTRLSQLSKILEDRLSIWDKTHGKIWN